MGGMSCTGAMRWACFFSAGVPLLIKTCIELHNVRSCCPRCRIRNDGSQAKVALLLHAIRFQQASLVCCTFSLYIKRALLQFYDEEGLAVYMMSTFGTSSTSAHLKVDSVHGHEAKRQSAHQTCQKYQANRYEDVHQAQLGCYMMATL